MNQVQKHSGLGIASFVVSLVFGFLIFIVFVVAGIMETSTPGGLDENSPQAMMIGLMIMAFLLAMLVALALGIAGLAQSERKKVFAVLGTIFSALFLLGTIFLVMIGMAMG